MATYALTAFTTRVINLNVGSPCGYVPIGVLKITDDWALNVQSGDIITATKEQVQQAYSYLERFPLVSALGGTSAQYNAGRFSGYTYPVESTPPTGYESKVKISKSGSNRIDVTLTLTLSNQLKSSGSSTTSTFEQLCIMTDKNDVLIGCTDSFLKTSQFTDTSINSFLAAGDNNGLPFIVAAGSTIYLSSTSFSYVVGSHNIALSQLDYRESAINTDPFEDGGFSQKEGGEGDFDGTGDDIEVPDLPETSATDSGFITLFNPSEAQLRALASYMWTGAFDINTFKKIFANPMDCILGLSIVPVAVPNGGSAEVKVGNISTGISMTKAATQFVEVDCGTLNVKEFWGAYLDYEPFTKAEIYLPYIGTHAISTDDIMNKAVHVVYHVDILSGACAAYIECDGTVLYQFIGQCSSSIPITGNDWTNVINGVISIAGAVGSMVATGGASAPLSVGAIASTVTNAIKPNIEKSGSMSGTGGMLGVQTPYLILTRPRQAVPANQNTFMGYPSFITDEIGDLGGYTELEHVHLENMSATKEELSEIEQLLKTGVIL